MMPSTLPMMGWTCPTVSFAVMESSSTTLRALRMVSASSMTAQTPAMASTSRAICM